MHIVPAALVIGGVFFMRIVLPRGLALLEPEAREQVFLKCRRGFKMTVHPCILLLLVSGTYNSIRLWSQYKANPPLFHSLWGGHVLLALIVIGLSLWLLAGKQPPKSHRSWVMTNLILLLAVVAVASTLKYARETEPHPHKPPAKHVAKPK
jgi:uncharacterized membrane protein